MTYLITQMLICLLLAAAIGFVLGWFLRGSVSGQAAEDVDVDDTATTYAIEDIEGIGLAFGKRLRDMGIETTQDLVDRGRRAEDRKPIAGRISVDDEAITQWTRMADLMRVAGVRIQFSELLEASGVPSVQDLAREDPEKLAARMAEVNARDARTRTVPSAGTVARWIEHAKTLPSLIEP